MLIADGMSCYDIRVASYVWRALCILAPILLLVFGSLDLLKAIIARDEKEQVKIKKKLPKRIIAFVIFLVLPILVRMIFSFGQYNSGNLGLLKCIVTFDIESTTPVSDVKPIEKDDDSSKKKCTDYTMATCPEKDENGWACTLIKKDGSSTPVCDYK